MGKTDLYDDDILLWSEQQAAALRRLARLPVVLPNDLDLEHVAEEIEDVGSGALKSVRSLIRMLFVHLMKVASGPELAAAAHWRGEARTFLADAVDRYTPSMAQRIDLDREWDLAAAIVSDQLMLHGDEALPFLPAKCPFLIGDIMDAPNLDALVARLQVRPPAGEA